MPKSAGQTLQGGCGGGGDLNNLYSTKNLVTPT